MKRTLTATDTSRRGSEMDTLDPAARNLSLACCLGGPLKPHHAPKRKACEKGYDAAMTPHVTLISYSKPKQLCSVYCTVVEAASGGEMILFAFANRNAGGWRARLEEYLFETAQILQCEIVSLLECLDCVALVSGSKGRKGYEAWGGIKVPMSAT
eukprot:1273187-Amphidinium_carterae.2